MRPHHLWLSHRQLADGSADALSLSLHQTWEGSGAAELPALPEGQICGLEERGIESDRLYTHVKHNLDFCQVQPITLLLLLRLLMHRCLIDGIFGRMHVCRTS